MLLSMLVGLALVADPEFRAPLSGARCGRIILEGNTDTPDRVIYARLDLRPGQRIAFGSLQAARERLRECPAFQSNPWRGIGPQVELLPNEFDSEFWDVRVVVVDRPENGIAFDLLDAVEESFWGTVTLDPERVAEGWDRLVRRAGSGSPGNAPR